MERSPVFWSCHIFGRRSESVKYKLKDGWGQKGALRNGTKLQMYNFWWMFEMMSSAWF